jgi:hypothetical protein
MSQKVGDPGAETNVLFLNKVRVLQFISENRANVEGKHTPLGFVTGRFHTYLIPVEFDNDISLSIIEENQGSLTKHILKGVKIL